MRIMRFTAFVFALSLMWSAPVLAQDQSAEADSVSYANTPWEYTPYNRFEDPHYHFFTKKLEYPGYGRHYPEPTHLETVKIGLIGPVIASVQESMGGPVDVPIRVNERKTRWDGYQYSHLADMGIKMMQGARLAIEMANEEGGYRGRLPYEMIVRNDNGAWRSSGRALAELAWKDSAWAVLGTIDGANTHILIRAALKAEIPVMNTADTDPTLVETNIPWVFRNITDDRQMCYVLADFAFKELGLERIAALRAVNRYGRMSIDEFRDAATRLGHPFVVELAYEEGDVDFTAQLERIRDLGVDGVATYGNSRESALILKQMRELGMDQWFFGSDRMVTDEFLEVVGDDHGKVAAGYPYDPESTAPKHVEFVEAFRERFGEEPETYAAHGYDGMAMLIDAIEQAGLNRAKIRDALVEMQEYEGATGLQVYDAVLSDRSPASLAILKNGEWLFFGHEEVLGGDLDLSVELAP